MKNMYLCLLIFFSMCFFPALSQGVWNTYTTSNTALQSNSLFTVYNDASGNVWVGTRYYDLSKFDGTTWSNYSVGNGSIRAIAVDQNNIKWFGTGTALTRYDGTTMTNYTTSNSNIAANNVYSILPDHDTLWVGTGFNGLSKYIQSTNTWTNYTTSNSNIPGSYIYSMARESGVNTTLWVGTNSTSTAQGAGRFNVNTSTWTTYNTVNSGLPNNNVLAIAIDGNNKWFGTQGGLAKFDGTSWTSYTKANSLLGSDTLYDVDVDANGIVWLSTASAGLVKFDGTTFTHYTTSNSSIPSNSITNFSIAADGTRWIATYYNGLASWKETISLSTVSGTNTSADLLNVFPNPVKGLVNVTYNQADAYGTVKVLSADGKVIFQTSPSTLATPLVLDLTAQKKGLYYVQVTVDQTVSTRKIIVE